jgi:hypothetical protein
MKKILIIIFTGFSISVLISCFSTEHFLIKSIDFYGVELTNPEVTNDSEKDFVMISDTLRDKLYFEVIGLGEYQYGYLQKSSFINSCYATSVPKELDNYLIVDSLQLRLDLDIYFEDDTIKANTDLWNHPKLLDYKWSINEDDLNDIVYGFNFGFVGEFYDKVRIPNKDYKIELTCKTSDGLILIKQIELFLKIGKG